MKVGYFGTSFRASLLLFVAFSSSIALSDGNCYLTQYPNGQYVITCEGDGMLVNYVEMTNKVYIIENCEQLKSELASAVNYISDELSFVFPQLVSISNNAEFIYYSTPSSQPDVRNSAESIQRQSMELYGRLKYVDDSLVSDNSSSLLSQINAIECGSCSTNNSGSCCDVDLTPILQKMNDAQSVRIDLTNFLYNVFSRPYAYTNSGDYYAAMYEDLTAEPQNENVYSPYDRDNLISVLNTISMNLHTPIASVNNYLYKISEITLPDMSTNLYVLTVGATNHFSFFRNLTFQDSPLIDFGQQSTFDSYYDFLTNHYVKVSFKQYNDLVGDEASKTNWFSRIETLLAALVFSDSDSTNTVDETFGQEQQDNIINSLEHMNQSSVTQVGLMSNMSDSLLDSLRSLNSSFSTAVSMPGEVRLVNLGSETRSESGVVSFQVSEIRQLVEACRCATTLAWCFGGIWLLYLFVSWSVKTSYSLCVFCWSVVDGIFGGGKT